MASMTTGYPALGLQCSSGRLCGTGSTKPVQLEVTESGHDDRPELNHAGLRTRHPARRVGFQGRRRGRPLGFLNVSRISKDLANVFQQFSMLPLLSSPLSPSF